jgi:tripartite-type tricarboxylate transporter receptor subunit TctC
MLEPAEEQMKWIARAAMVFSASIVAGPGIAQTFPEKPIQIVVGFPPGGPADSVARLLGQKLGESIGVNIVVNNLPGAAGNIATGRVAKAPSDGYTLGLVTEAQILINPSLYKLSFDPIKDFQPVSQLTVSPYLLVVHRNQPARSVQQLVNASRTQPGSMTFGSAGTGTTPHIAAELFRSASGSDLRHIPYKGLAPAMADLLGERITMMFSPVGTALPMVREGKLRALAVSSLKRTSTVPDLPTISEAGYPGFDVTGWLGLIAPSKVPTSIVRKLNTECATALAVPDIRAKLADLGMETITSTPDDLAKVIESGIGRWTKVIQEARIRLD